MSINDKKMKKKVFLSIIIPTFNKLDNVLDLLKSINIQNIKNTEIIIVDDGSKPKLKKKLTKFKIKYKFIKNSGPATARNLGAKISSGKFLLFVDSDLILPKNFLYKLKNFLKKGKVKVGSITYGIKSNVDNIFSQYKAFFDHFNVSLKLKKKEDKLLLGSACVFERKIFFKYKGWNQDIKTPSIENEEFTKRLQDMEIIRLKNFHVEHKFPTGKYLFKEIFQRSNDWVFSKLNNKVEFDGLSRSKKNGFFSLQPLLFFATLLLIYIDDNFPSFILYIPLFLFILGNLNFFYFLLENDKLIRIIKYVFIHFFFCFFVSLGALVGLFKYSFYRIFN